MGFEVFNHLLLCTDTGSLFLTSLTTMSRSSLVGKAVSKNLNLDTDIECWTVISL